MKNFMELVHTNIRMDLGMKVSGIVERDLDMVIFVIFLENISMKGIMTPIEDMVKV